MAVHILALTWALDEGAWYLHALATSPLGQDSVESIGQETGWASQSGCCSEEKSLCLC
jgi:hypothetical protein